MIIDNQDAKSERNSKMFFIKICKRESRSTKAIHLIFIEMIEFFSLDLKNSKI